MRNLCSHLFARRLLILRYDSCRTYDATNSNKLVLQPLIHDNLDELAPDIFAVHTRHFITASATVTLIPLDLLSSVCQSLSAIHCVTWWTKSISSMSLSTSLPKASFLFGLINFKCAFFSQLLSSFIKMYPYHRNLFCHTTVAMSSVPYLGLDTTQDNLSVNLTPHIHLIAVCTLQCYFFSPFIGHVSLPCIQNKPSHVAPRRHI